MAEEKDSAEEGQDSKKQGGKKKLIIIIAVVLLLGGGAAGAYFAGVFGGGDEHAEEEPAAEEHATEEEHGEKAGHGEEKAEGEHGEAAKGEHGEGGGAEQPTSPYVDMPDILVNLNSTTDQPSFIKMKVTLELAKPEDLPLLNERMPILQDLFNTYLRDVRVSDLSGSAGIYRLREELSARANKALSPAKITNIYFREIMVQ